MRTIEKYSFGVGDRFAHQAESQLKAFVEAEKLGIHIVPVWNKSHREHTTIGSQPDSVRAAGDAAVKALGWSKSHYVDADHINLGTVDGFLAASDFFKQFLRAIPITCLVEDMMYAHTNSLDKILAAMAVDKSI